MNYELMDNETAYKAMIFALAEAAKVIENIKRYVNITLMNFLLFLRSLI